MTRSLRLLLLPLLALALVAAACSDDDDDGGDSDDPTATATSESTDESTVDPTATPRPSSNGGEGPIGPVGPDSPDLDAPPITGTGRLVFISDAGGNPDVWSVNPDGSDLTQLTQTPEEEAAAYWAPGGDRIGFTRFDGEQVTFHVMEADGSGIRGLDEGTLQAWVDRLSVSNDGNTAISLQQGGVVDGSGELLVPVGFPADTVGDAMTIAPDGSAVTLGLAQNIFQGLPAGEGERILENEDFLEMTALADTLYEIVTIDTATGALTPLTDNGVRDWLPVWSPDSQSIAFLSNRDATRPGIWVMNADGSDVRLVVPPPPPGCDCFGPSRVQWSR